MVPEHRRIFDVQQTVATHQQEVAVGAGANVVKNNERLLLLFEGNDLPFQRQQVLVVGKGVDSALGEEAVFLNFRNFVAFKLLVVARVFLDH